MVFQNYDLFPHMSVLKNIIFAPILVQKREKSEVSEKAEKLLDRVGLISKKDAYPHELSGGQKQRVAIVRSLILNPKIMLFDEVTASLDPEMSNEVLHLMEELADGGMTEIIVTHELSFAKAIAKDVIFMDNGKILEHGLGFFENPKTESGMKFLDIFKY
jgi:polar amino acid transport system ATP-binding protein